MFQDGTVFDNQVDDVLVCAVGRFDQRVEIRHAAENRIHFYFVFVGVIRIEKGRHIVIERFDKQDVAEPAIGMRAEFNHSFHERHIRA